VADALNLVKSALSADESSIRYIAKPVIPSDRTRREKEGISDMNAKAIIDFDAPLNTPSH